jgi:hypothetical protein
MSGMYPGIYFILYWILIFIVDLEIILDIVILNYSFEDTSVNHFFFLDLDSYFLFV